MSSTAPYAPLSLAQVDPVANVSCYPERDLLQLHHVAKRLGDTAHAHGGVREQSRGAEAEWHDCSSVCGAVLDLAFDVLRKWTEGKINE